MVSFCDNCVCLRCCGWKNVSRAYFASECVIIIYLSKLTNQVLILLVQYHTRLCVFYFDCTRGYLQFDMLFAIVAITNNETCLFRTRSADD